MSATLVHRNPALMDPLMPGGGGGVAMVTPIMAVSVCRPTVGEGMPSRHGSATSRTRQTSAKSLPGHGQIRLALKETNAHPLSTSLSSHHPHPHPPTEFTSESKDGLKFPQIKSPNQLCSSNSQISISADAQNDVNNADRQWIVTPPDKPSAFPNFRALQRLAASAKLRFNNLKSKEAKAITAMMVQDSQAGAMTGKASNDVMLLRYPQGDAENVENSVLDSSWSTQGDESVQNGSKLPTAPSEHASSTSRSKTKKTFRSKSRRRGLKSGAKRKKKPVSPASTGRDSSVLGNHQLASSITLSSRWESKDVETFSSRYNPKVSPRKPKATDHKVSPEKSGQSHLTLTTVALEKRHVGTTPRTRENKSDATMPTPRMVLEQAANVYGHGSQLSVRLSRPKGTDAEHLVKRVFLSEKQSDTLKDCGKLVPCAPPASPTPEQLQKYEYVPSLGDLRSQRALKDRLAVMDADDKKKRQKQREDRARQEKQNMRSNICLIRQRQRQEIYALNKVMTEHENGQFLKFCESMKGKDKT